jgi:hypothetical protein
MTSQLSKVSVIRLSIQHYKVLPSQGKFDTKIEAVAGDIHSLMVDDTRRKRRRASRRAVFQGERATSQRIPDHGSVSEGPGHHGLGR